MGGFFHPLWLAGLLLVPVLLLWYRRAVRQRRRAALAFSRVAALREAAAGARTPLRPVVLLALPLLAVSFVFIGLAGPHIPLEQAAEGVSVVLVMDVSGSMQATDYAPTRLDAAKSAAEVLLKSLREDDYAGIITFESGARSTAYLSPDRDRVIGSLRAIEPRTGSTALGDGLLLGIDMADAIPGRRKVVVLLSDGVANAGTVTPDEAASFAQERGIQVFTVGIGSDAPVITGYDAFGTPEYAELDEKTLQRIAAETGGTYYRSVNETTLRSIYESIAGEIPREPQETDIGVIFFIGALVAILVEFYLRYGRGRILP